ncbi:MAG: universal stress protein [Hydrogenothermaceae bacterium]
MFKSIVVGYDNSKSSEKALEKAVEITKSCGAKLHIVGVIRPLDFGYIDYITPEEIDKYEKEEITKEEKFLKKAMEKVAKEGLEATYKVLEGDPAEELMSYADENNCDLIVVRRRGSGGLKRLLMGSTSSTIVKYANQDVLVVV